MSPEESDEVGDGAEDEDATADADEDFVGAKAEEEHHDAGNDEGDAIVI